MRDPESLDKAARVPLRHKDCCKGAFKEYREERYGRHGRLARFVVAPLVALGAVAAIGASPAAREPAAGMYHKPCPMTHYAWLTQIFCGRLNYWAAPKRRITKSSISI